MRYSSVVSSNCIVASGFSRRNSGIFGNIIDFFFCVYIFILFVLSLRRNLKNLFFMFFFMGVDFKYFTFRFVNLKLFTNCSVFFNFVNMVNLFWNGFV